MRDATTGTGFTRAPAGSTEADLRRSTSHAVTCDYLVGRGFRVCSCRGPRGGGAGR